MKKKTLLLISLTILIGFGFLSFPILANAGYTIGYYFPPYTSSFIQNGFYEISEETGFHHFICYNCWQGSKYGDIYKGVVGNSTIISGMYLGSGANSETFDITQFGSWGILEQGDNLFVAIYEYSEDMRNYFLTGSPAPQKPYATLSFHYGTGATIELDLPACRTETEDLICHHLPLTFETKITNATTTIYNALKYQIERLDDDYFREIIYSPLRKECGDECYYYKPILFDYPDNSINKAKVFLYNKDDPEISEITDEIFFTTDFKYGYVGYTPDIPETFEFEFTYPYPFGEEAGKTLVFEKLTGGISFILNPIGNWTNFFVKFFNPEEATAKANEMGGKIKLVKSYFNYFDSFFGGFPVALIFTIFLMILMAKTTFIWIAKIVNLIKP